MLRTHDLGFRDVIKNIRTFGAVAAQAAAVRARLGRLEDPNNSKEGPKTTKGRSPRPRNPPRKG